MRQMECHKEIKMKHRTMINLTVINLYMLACSCNYKFAINSPMFAMSINYNPYQQEGAKAGEP